MGDISRAGAMIQRDPVNRQINHLIGCTITVSEELEQTLLDGYLNPDDCDVKRDFGLSEKKSSVVLNVSTKTVDDYTFDWMIMNERKQSTPSIIVPNTVAATIVGGSVTVAGLTLDQQIGATILITAKPGKIPLTQQASGTGVTATTFEVSVGQVDFDATYEGRQVLIFYYETVTNQEGYGGNRSLSRFDDVEFAMKVCGDKMSDKRFWFPKCTSNTGLNLDLQAEEYEREYNVFVDIERGFTRQFLVW